MYNNESDSRYANFLSVLTLTEINQAYKSNTHETAVPYVLISIYKNFKWRVIIFSNEKNDFKNFLRGTSPTSSSAHRSRLNY